MGEFGRSGEQMPTEARAEGRAEHQEELEALAEHEHQVHEAEHRPAQTRRPWWKFWQRA
jgi:hypothetical protein